MSLPLKAARLAAAAAAALLMVGAAPMDPVNQTCPLNPDWSANRTMVLTPVEQGGRKLLLAEGRIDSALPKRLAAALAANPEIEEIWLRSPGGDARAGNAAGRIIRANPGLMTRIPRNWACFSACNFVFMGGQLRAVDPGGLFIVHMFTRTGDRDAIDSSVAMGTAATTELIGEIEQDAAMLASEDNDFLIRMGISRKLLTEVMYRQSAVPNASDKSTRRCLSQAEVRSYNVANVSE